MGHYDIGRSEDRLILKDSSQLERAKLIFQNSNFKFTYEEKRHLGAALGTDEFKITYVNGKLEKWCKEMENLSKLAKIQSHAAFPAYINGKQQKFINLLRTIKGMKELDDIVMNAISRQYLEKHYRLQKRKYLRYPYEKAV